MASPSLLTSSSTISRTVTKKKLGKIIFRGRGKGEGGGRGRKERGGGGRREGTDVAHALCITEEGEHVGDDVEPDPWRVREG
jgi:hypothetical protein